MTPFRLRLEWLLLLLLAFAGAVAGQWAQATYRIDNRLLDFASSLSRPAINPDIFIVEIDDRALAEIGAWPWPRSQHAALIDALDRAGARLILLDVLFVEPTAMDQDAALAEAMRRSGKVLLPYGFARAPNTLDTYEAAMPLPLLADAARATGHVGALPDEDGVLRRFALGQQSGGTSVPHLAVATLDVLDEPLPRAPARMGGGANYPMIAFQQPGSFPALSAADILAGRVPRGMVDDKIVLIGATSAGLGDRFAVASGTVKLMPGVETQANLINALRAGSVILPYRSTVHTIVSAVVLIVLFLAFWFFSPRYGLIVAAGLLAGTLGASIALVPLAGRWLPSGSLALAILISYPLWSWRRLSAVSAYLEREARRIGGDAVDADVEGVDFIARQVSRMRRLVHSVEDSLAFLRQVIEAAPDAILVLDRDGATQMMNARAQALFPEWQSDAQPDLRELLLDVRARFDEEHGEIATADGKTFLVARAPLGRDAGDSGEILVLREVTDIRRREEERKQMLEFLSHDMRTPQVAIIGLAQTKDPGTVVPETLGRIRKQAERTLKLADDFVQLARLEEAALILEECDIGALIDEACDRFFAQAKAKRIGLVQQLPEEPMFAAVDAAMIARLLDNLIGNAIKYSPECSSVELSLTLHHGSRVQLTVADEGPGLPPQRREDIFARFGAREHMTTRGAGPSAGLGLAFVKRAVEAHGGTVEVDTSRHRGTCFVIEIPVGAVAA